MKELRNEVGRLKSDFEQKWSSQIKMVDANNRSVFKMHDKMVMLTDWLRSLGKNVQRSTSFLFFEFFVQIKCWAQRFYKVESKQIRWINCKIN